MTIAYYIDKECKKALADLNDAVEIEGQTARATVYLRNEDSSRFAITDIKFPDEVTDFSIEKGVLEPHEATRLTFSMRMPYTDMDNEMIRLWLGLYTKKIITGIKVSGYRLEDVIR